MNKMKLGHWAACLVWMSGGCFAAPGGGTSDGGVSEDAGAREAASPDASEQDASPDDGAAEDSTPGEGGMDGSGGGEPDGGGPPPSCGDCDDGVSCTRDRCTDGVCRHDPDDDACMDGERCFPDVGCRVPPECTSDEACDDGQYCNGTELCGGDGRCSPGSPPCGGATPYCDEAMDRCLECTSNAHCDDGLACNGTEQCIGGRCVMGDPVQCDDRIACTVDSCMEPTGTCLHQGPDRDGDGYVATGCASGNDCDDEDASVYPGASERCNVADDDCDGQCDEGLSGCRIPIHRLFNGRDFMPSIHRNEGSGVGYRLHRDSVFYVYASNVPGVVAPGHRCYNASTGDHFIATTSTCEGRSGYMSEAIIGYGLPPSSAPRCGSVMLKRYYNPSTGDRIASPHPDEQDWALRNGYVFELNVGQVWLTP